MGAFYDPANYGFTADLERAFEGIFAELLALEHGAFVESPDSLTTVADGYDETGWHYFDLFGEGASGEGKAGESAFEANRRRCPIAAAACAAVPGMRNAGFSRFAAGTHLYPHRGEIEGVLRCHLPLIVPPGDLGIRAAGETRRWERGRCLVFDDTIEHEAWNRGDGDRVVLLVTFAR